MTETVCVITVLLFSERSFALHVLPVVMVTSCWHVVSSSMLHAPQ